MQQDKRQIPKKKFTTVETIGQYDLASRVSNVGSLNLILDKATSVSTDLLESMARSCGLDENNGFLTNSPDSKSGYAFMLCPRMLARMIGRKSADEVSLVLTHEFGHRIDGTAAYKIGEQTVDFWSRRQGESDAAYSARVLTAQSDPFQVVGLDERYAPFLECISQNYLGDAGDNRTTVRYIREKAAPELNRKIARMQSKKLNKAEKEELKHLKEMAKEFSRAPDICRDGKALPAMDQLVADLKKQNLQLNFDPKTFCATPQRNKGFDRELVADHFAQEILIDRVVAAKSEDRKGILKNSLQAVCRPKESLDMEHPPANVRIDHIFFNPKLRKALGRSKYPLIQRYPNEGTHLEQTI